MAPAKPVRVIDVSRKLNLATSTIIDFLGDRGYPVERSHHSPLIKEVLQEVLSEYVTDGSQSVAEAFSQSSELWEKDHGEIAVKIRQKYYKGRDRIDQRRERARRVMEGRERARAFREQSELKKQRFSNAMQSVSESVTVFDGRILPGFLSLEIIRRALALDQNKKQQFLNQLRKISETQLN